MRMGKLALAVLTAGFVTFSAAGASAAWYDGSHNGMADKFCNWLAELIVCDGWSGCN